jgi:general stress protein CsbA
MRYSDGSTWGGIVTVLLIFAALMAGYHLRDRGWIINIDQSGVGRATSTR